MKIKRKETIGKLSILLLSLSVFTFLSASPKLTDDYRIPGHIEINYSNSPLPISLPVTLYEAMDLKDEGLSKTAFYMAIKGYEELRQTGQLLNPSVLTIIDFSKPSTEERLFVLDIDSMKVLYKTYVAHGRNSGTLYAKKFSNKTGSHMSSIGFYITGDTYSGDNGYSLKLNGLEKGINDKAAQRAIVVHGAYYVTPSFASTKGYIGRSFGCPALPQKISKPIIDAIKDGSCLFIYGRSEIYKRKSHLL